MNILKSKFFQYPAIKKPLLVLDHFLWWDILARFVPDKMYLSLVYRLSLKKKMNWKSPQTYNEKIQWLKIYGRTDENRIMADKYLVKEYVSKKIGKEYVIPLLGVWDNENEIDFEKLPNRFVLKCNQNSGTGMVVCKDKSLLDIDKVKKGLRKGLKEDYYSISREYAYKDIPRKIIAEEYVEDNKTKELRDYKFFCFNGDPKIMFIASGRSKGEHNVTFDFYDMDFNHLPFTNGHPNASFMIEKPDGFEEMKELSKKLSQGIPHVRVDFYEANGRIYFGEFTFSHWGGLKPFDPEEWDYKLGSWIELPQRR